MNYHVIRVSDSGSPLIDLTEAKLFLKVSHTKEDSLIMDLIERTINDVEAFTYQSLQTSVYKLLVSHWMYGCIPISRGPVNAITEVKYYNESNSIQTLASTEYFLSQGCPDFLMRQYNKTWPSIFPRPDAIQITYSTTPDVESGIKTKVLQAVAYQYENRSEVDLSMDRVYAALFSGISRKHFINIY